MLSPAINIAVVSFMKGGHTEHNSYLITGTQNSRNDDPGLVCGRQLVLTCTSCRIELPDNTDEKCYHQQLNLHYSPTKPFFSVIFYHIS